MHARASFFHSEVSIDQVWMNGDKIFRSHEHVQCSSKLMTKSESWLGLGPIDAPWKGRRQDDWSKDWKADDDYLHL